MAKAERQARCQGQRSLLRVDADGAVLQPTNAEGCGELVESRGDLPRLKFTAEKFVEQGLKDEPISGFDQHHWDVRMTMAQGLYSAHATETSANHNRGVGLR